ncbi:MAG: hypothetical protein U0521_01415 [Anaerolineae bacterium]
MIGIARCWLIVYRYFSPRAAFVTRAAVRRLAWAILYSRKIWGQDMHTPLILAGFLLGTASSRGSAGRERCACPCWCSPCRFTSRHGRCCQRMSGCSGSGASRISRGAVALSMALALLTLVPFSRSDAIARHARRRKITCRA